jgi:D-alanyl-D-alanine carboxypeptidase
MFRAGGRPARRLGRIVLTLTALVLGVAVACDSADARARRHRSHGSAHGSAHRSYDPPYAAIVVDGNSGQVLHASNPDALRHPASLTKIMTLYLLFEQLEAGKLKLDSRLPVSAHASAQSPTKLELHAGQTIQVEDAIKAIVTKSANDAAVVVAEAIGGSEDNFGRLMTRKAHALGMTRTVYVNASGLPNNEQLTTARDQATLGRAIQERFPRYYRYFSTSSFRYHGMAMRNHNHLLGRVEGMDGIKTGYTHDSGFNLVTSVRRSGRHLVSVVLGGSSAGSRDARMRELIERHIAQAATRRTAPMVAETATAPARGPELASVRPEASVAAAIPAARPHPAPGSADPIRPMVVRTIQVKSGPVQTASLGPLVIPAPNSTMVPPQLAAPAPQPALPAPAPQVAAPAPAPQTALPPPPGARPGVLGVLPGRPAARRSEPAPVNRADSAPAYAPRANAKPAATFAERITGAAEPDTVVADAPAAQPASQPVHHAALRGDWAIQIGAFPEEGQAKERLRTAQSVGKSVLRNADPFTEKVVKGSKELYRARFAGFDKDGAEAACHHFKRNDIACMALKN